MKKKESELVGVVEVKLEKKLNCLSNRYCISRMNLLRLGDVEINPGPLQDVGIQNKLPVNSLTLLNFRLGQLGLIALDVGGAGDCFFLEPHHINCLVTPIITFTSDKLLFNTLRDNPERCIESDTQNSWNGYLISNCNARYMVFALIIQAVAESLNTQIYIVESHVNFGPVTLIESHHSSSQQPKAMHIGHVKEVCYVSTVPNSSYSGNKHHNSSYCDSSLTRQTVFSQQDHPSSRKRKCNSDLKNIRISTTITIS